MFIEEEIETNIEENVVVTDFDLELEEMAIMESLGNYSIEGAKLEYAALTEADEATKEEKKQSVVKYAAEKLKALKEKIAKLFKNIWNWIKEKFVKLGSNKIISMVKKRKISKGKAKVKDPEKLVKEAEDIAKKCEDAVSEAANNSNFMPDEMTIDEEPVNPEECEVDASKAKQYIAKIQNALKRVYNSITTALTKLKNTFLVQKLMKAAASIKNKLVEIFQSIISAIKQFGKKNNAEEKEQKNDDVKTESYTTEIIDTQSIELDEETIFEY